MNIFEEFNEFMNVVFNILMALLCIMGIVYVIKEIKEFDIEDAIKYVLMTVLFIILWILGNKYLP